MIRKRYKFYTFFYKLTSQWGLGVVFQAISLSKHNPVAQQAPDPTSKSCSVDTCRSGVQNGLPTAHSMIISLSPHLFHANQLHFRHSIRID